MRNISKINKYGIIGLCEYCKSKIENDVPCKHCNEAVKKFIVHKNEKVKDTNDFIQWANKFKYVLESDKRKSHSHPDLLLNKQRISSPRLFHEPTGHLGVFENDLQTPINSNKTQYEHLLKKYKQENYSSSYLDSKFTDVESLEYNGELRLKKSYNEKIKVMGYSDTTYKKYNALKLPSKYVHISLDDINAKFYDFDIPLLQRKYSSYTTLNYRDNIKRSDEYLINKIVKQDLSKKTDVLNPNSDTEKILFQLNKEKLLDLSSEKSPVNFDETLAQGSLQKSFSFFFIKKSSGQPKYPRIAKSSSELIKEAQDIIHAKAEKEKQQLKDTKNISNETKIQDNQLNETKNISEGTKIKDNQLKETKIKSKETDLKDEKIKNKKSQLKSKTLIDETKEKLPQKDKKTSHDDKTGNATFAKPSYKIFYKNGSKTSLDVPKREKPTITKSKEEEKNIKTDILKVEKESTKVKNEPKKRQVEKDQKETIKKEENKKKEESSTKEEVKKFDKKDELEEFKKILAEQKKQKEEEKRAKKKEEENHKIKKAADKTVPTQELLLKNVEAKTTKKQSKETKSDVKPDIQTKAKLKVEDANTDDLQMNQIIVRTPSTDDLILRLVKLKQSYQRKDKERPKRLSEINIDPNVIAAHKCHQNKQPNCIICNDSELELDIENIVNKIFESPKVADIIVGEKILKHKPHLEQNVKKPIISPLFFSSTLQDDVVNIPEHDFFTNVTEGGLEKKTFSIKNVSVFKNNDSWDLINSSTT